MPTALISPPTDIRTDIDSETRVEMLLELDDRSLVVDRDRIRIGSSPQCEIHLDQGPLLHSVVRAEAGVIWIEADDLAAELMVNWRNCRRMSLRDGDVISVPGHEITVHQRPMHAIEVEAARLTEDIHQLTAEELCDRLLSEQSAVDEFESGKLQGWRKLMSAITSVVSVDQDSLPSQDDAPAEEFSDDCERLLDQIREMSEMMSGRTQELDECEHELEAATALLQETQDRVSRQIEDLLDQIGDASAPNELRVSA